MKSEINKYNKREDSSELSMLKNQYASNIEEIVSRKINRINTNFIKCTFKGI